MSRKTIFQKVREWLARDPYEPPRPEKPTPKPTPTPTPDPNPKPEPTERELFVYGALKRVGKPYCSPPNAVKNCTDCSGLVKEEYWKATGREVSGDSHSLYADLPAVNSGTDLQPGDLVFWSTGFSRRRGNDASHVGIVSRYNDGHWLVVNALNEQRGIVETPLDANYGGPYLGARRLPFQHEAGTSPKAPSPVAFTLPSGPIQTPAPNGGSFGIDWAQVQRWEPTFREAAKTPGWDAAPLFMALMSVIETRANHYTTGRLTGTRDAVIVRAADGYDREPAVGILQVKLGYHQWRVPTADGWTPTGNIQLATAIMRDGMKQCGSWEEAIRRLYFPGNDAATATTQDGYIRTLRALIHEAKGERATPASDRGKPYSVPGLGTIYLPFPLEVHIIPAWQTNQRPGDPLWPDRYIQHGTGNPNAGANADMHRRYLEQGAPDQYGRSQQLSYHVTVDDQKAVWLIPANEVAWHGGDGNGPCNFKGLSCEMCENADRDVAKTRRNAAILAAEVMNAAGIERLAPHISCVGTDHHCPQTILDAPGGWDRYAEEVAALREERR